MGKPDHSLLDKMTGILSAYLELQNGLGALSTCQALREKYPRLVIQFVNPGMVVNLEHIRQIGRQAFYQWCSDRLLAAKKELDLLLRVACDSQISRAIISAGISGDFRRVAVIAIGDGESLHLLEGSLEDLGVISTADSTDLASLEELKKKHGLRRLVPMKGIDEARWLVRMLVERAALLGLED